MKTRYGARDDKCPAMRMSQVRNAGGRGGMSLGDNLLLAWGSSTDG
jgi:hypothetical protein